MRILVVCCALVTAVMGFSPVRTTSRVTTAHSMSVVDDWKNFFSPRERQHRKEQHEKKMAEMEASQKEILERRRDPEKMKVYHDQEEARHEKFDRQHDIQVEQELEQEWTPSTEKPYTNVAPVEGHNVLDDWKKFFSKPEAEHRRMQHHLELLDTADAEKEILERRRDPVKMKAYKEKEELRHKRLDKQHEIEAGFEFVEEQVDPKLEKGTDFIDDVSVALVLF